MIAPDVGGGFGSKIFIYAEECVCHLGGEEGWPAGEVDGRAHRRASSPTPTAATTSPMPSWRWTPTATSWRSRSTPRPTSAPTCRPSRSCVPTYLYATLLAGQYKTPAIYCEVEALYTNTAPVDAYRGAGRPEASYPDRDAGRSGGAGDRPRSGRVAPAELHPPRTPSPTRRRWRLMYDTGDYEATPRQGARARRLRGLRGAQGRRPKPTASSARHRLLLLHRGLRHRTLGGGRLARRRRRACGRAPRSASAHTGKVQVLTGTHSHGQGHETTFAQLVADKLGVPFEDVEVHPRRHREDAGRHGHLRLALARGRRLGDRQGLRQDHRQGQEDRGPPAGGVGGRHRVQEWQVHRRRHRPGQVDRRGRVRRLRAAQLPARVSSRAWRRRRLLRSAQLHLPGRHLCLRGRGRSRRPGWCGSRSSSRSTTSASVINPMIVEGQVHGGLVQGIGQALFEGCRLRRRTASC